ncbi:MAG: sigma 54-interacting transcriptional regulator, partial [Opitutaceae bacterium]
ESELFGHERGAFTGAEARRIGRFEQADGGTLFLDEVGDMTPATQVKLLRVLQEKSLQRLGGKETVAVDVRVIAATHRDLDSAMADKQFREDLYYRLSVMVIALPPLRHRREDIPDLVRYFLHKHGPALGAPEPSIRPEAMTFLQAQPWPGNVRHLENVIRKVLLSTQGYTINLDHVRSAADQIGEPGFSASEPFGEYVDQLLAEARGADAGDAHARALEAAERELFSRAIRQANGNQARAARWLGVSRITMKAKLVQFGLHPGREA